MKKTFFLLSALALVGLASCEKPQVNPDYNAETDEVTTQFVLNVSAGQSPQTRMTAANVQKDNFNFLGMQDAVMYAYKTENVSPVYVTNESTSKKDYSLGILYAAGTVEHANNKTNRILQLTIPTGVNSVLMYAKAINNVPAADPTKILYYEDPVRQNEAARGKTEINVSSTMANTTFDALRRLSTDQLLKDYHATGRLMVYVINSILGTSIADATEPYKGYTGLGSLSWRNLGHKYIVDNWNSLTVPGYASLDVFRYDHFTDAQEAAAGLNRPLLPLEEVIGRTYYLFTSIETGEKHEGEYRSGSSAAIKNMMESMNSMIQKAIGATPTSAEEANAMRLADAIYSKMSKYFNTTDWTYNSINSIQTEINNSTLWNDETNGFAGAKDLNRFPYGDFGIPEGAAQLSFNHATDEFSHIEKNKALVSPEADNFDPRKYVFPAELMYYVNSGLRLTDEEVSASDFPNGVDPWISGINANTSNNLWTAKNWVANTSITSSTHGVAVRDNINYGVALLKTSVHWTAAAISGGLEDNRAAFGSTTQTFTTTELNLELHGILVGGINPRYDWQYLPIERVDPSDPDHFGNFDGVIYDDQIVDAGIPTDDGKETYTLVYDNYNREKAADEQNNVYVTLEFVNKGDAFWGRDNLIPTNGTFYLVAKLDPNTAKTDAGYAGGSGHNPGTLEWDANYQVPPTYGVTKNKAGNLKAAADATHTAGTSMQVARVFIQNYMTTAKFYLGTNSLKSAYYSVPDLKSAQLSVGLSVDLSWKDGYTYEIEF